MTWLRHHQGGELHWVSPDEGGIEESLRLWKAFMD